MKDEKKLINLNKLIRRDIIEMTTAAQSGHTTSALSAVELMSSLMMGGYFDHTHDKLIFSKGHATPLLYSLYHQLGHISHEELLKYRQFDSNLDGHPVPNLPFVDVATGSLGLGISMAIGMGLAKKRESAAGKIFVLCGDSEMAEGQIYEALQVASYYHLDNIVMIMDVNKFGQRGETMLRHDIDSHATRVSAFGWNTYVINDGHDIEEITKTYDKSIAITNGQPTCIMARTVKGKGVEMWEGLNGFHSKQLTAEQAKDAIIALQIEVDEVKIPVPTLLPKLSMVLSSQQTEKIRNMSYGPFTKNTGTKEVVGASLSQLVAISDRIISLDAEMSDSTTTEIFNTNHPDHFYEMFVAEQNMISVSVGLSAMGYLPVATTFSSFMFRAFDQIRMAQYSKSNLKIIGTYAGVATGMDGPSGMGLEDMALMRSILESVVLYPCDALSASKIIGEMIIHTGISYLRLTREKTPNIYSTTEQFPIGGSKVLMFKGDTLTYTSDISQVSQLDTLIIGAGITVHEGVKAQKILENKGVKTVVVDAYSIKPIDAHTITQLARQAKKVIVVEDHYPHGGLGDAVREALVNAKISIQFSHLCVKKIPKSGKPAELLAYEEIDAAAIVRAVETT